MNRKHLIYVVAALCAAQPLTAQPPATSQTARGSKPIPIALLGEVAGKQYQGGGLSVAATPEGARLRCVFQRLEGRVTPEGLWLESTEKGGGRVRLVASSLGCAGPVDGWAESTMDSDARGMAGQQSDGVMEDRPLPFTGTVSVADKLVRFIRPGLTEEYSVSMDGVRQDFIVVERPAGVGNLRVELALAGAAAEPVVNGVRLVLEGSERKLAYSRLRATDAAGRELAARLGVTRATRLAVVVDDAKAAYPVRIDPTFSDADWISLGSVPGADSTVRAAIVDCCGNLYIGGEFTTVGDVVANHVAKWNGSTWSALGSGVDGNVWALAVSGTDLYVGGSFATAGGTAASYIAKWNGSAWSALGSGINGSVWALAVSGTDLYAGGDFTTAGGTAASQIAKWDGSTWSAFGTGLNGRVYALAVSGADLYAGGSFTTAGTTAASSVAKWDGSAWSALGSGMGGSWQHVTSLAVLGTNLFAGGSFTTAGGTAARYIAKWDGSAWSALGTGVDGAVYTLAVSGTDLYAGGLFATAGGTKVNCIAKWDGSTWSGLGSGMGGSYPSVFALTVSGRDFYAGGEFITAGGAGVVNIAKWDGSAWSGWASGMNGDVWALAVSGPDLYAGGYFETAGGTPATNIAKWNGRTWSALGSGVDNEVYALAVSGTDLYAAGWFISAGGIPATNIARWNGSTWSALGSGMSGTYPYVWALAVSGTDLYAAGWFISAGGIPATNIARWNGSAWSPLGPGVNGDVCALALSGTDLYVGGTFTTAGETAANYVAKWDGSVWSPLGSGMAGMGGGYAVVYALAVSGADLYAGGDFTTAGETEANCIAKWDGSTWSALGSGMNNRVYALAVSRTDLFAGGSFTAAGNKVAGYAAMARILAVGKFSNPAYSRTTGFRFVFSEANIGQSYCIQSCSSLVNPNWVDLIGFTYPGPVTITDPSAVEEPNKFYRAISP